MSGERILIVDDEPMNVELFDVMLSKLGFEIEKASDGDEALEKLRSFDPALILLDNVIPRLSGWEVTQRVKNDDEYAQFSAVSIIMFSALDEVKDKVQGLELGVDDYITKPFNFTEVLARIRAVLHRRELRDQVTRRERRIGVVESLNGSLIFFAEHVRQPLADQLATAESLVGDGTDWGQLSRFVTLVTDNSREILGKLKALEDEISELQRQGAELKEGDLSLDELQKKLQNHLGRLTTTEQS